MSLHLPRFHERHITPIQVLWEDGERIVYRALRDEPAGDRRTVLLVLPATETPSNASLDRLAHEYGLKDHLDAPWAVRPLDLLRDHGRTMLVLDDPGGDLLQRFTGSPMALPTFLRLAEALAAALRGLHERGLIHRDIHPANILVSDSMNHVRLTGFGASSRLLRERQAPTPPELIAGTLPYMAPEQTGRMNRSMDARSDLYSLGVTLYQLLTGALPFSAADPLEWVHCHIARQPVAPADRGAVPKPLSAIVMKLLAKNAEDRYQTASGLEHDLRQCRTEWEMRGGIEEFPLAAHDVPDQFWIPEKLYGRSREVATLLRSFEHVIATGAPELVLVSGYSGVGKSSVVNELHKVLVPPRGLFAFGKFDQYKRGIPYATVAQAFQRLVMQLLGKSEAELQAWREAFRDALGPNGLLISGLIPELELVIGKQPPVSELPPHDAKRRFQTVLRRFIAVFARPEHPLALFLDDLQWLDDATLDLLADILVEGDIRHLLLIGAYRDNEVDATHPLMRKLDAIRGAGAVVHDIVLAPLSYGDLGQLIGDSLRCEPQRAGPLVQLLQEKTGGNPFFASQFLYALADEALLSFDRTDTRWSWDLGRIHAKHYTDNVVDLMIVKLNRLPVETLAVLRQLACVGFEAELAFLATICQTSEEELHKSLWEAVRSRLLLRSENLYTFPHDRIQEAAYSLVPEEARAEAHLRIGRLLLAHTPPDKREEVLFDIVNQFNRGAELITTEDERFQLAELNLAAGKRAKASTAHASALAYFIAGRLLLTTECWERRADLIFQLELHRAECEFLTGEPAVAAERLEMLRTRAADTVGLAMATCLGIDVYLAVGQVDRAVAVGRDYLRHLAIDWPLHPTEEQVRSEYQRVWTQLGSRAIEDVMSFPLMEDSPSIGALDVLTKVLPASLHIDVNLFAWVVCRAVSLSIEHGNNDGSCFCYVWLSTIAGLRFGDYESAFRFGQLGYDLVEKRGLKRFEARTYDTFAAISMPWMKPLLACCDVMRRAFEIANKAGDLTYAVFSLIGLPPLLLGAGIPLNELECEAASGLDFAQKAKFDLVTPVTNLQLGLIRTLRGSTSKFGSLDHPEFDEIVFERHLDSQSAMAGCWYWIAKMQARFFAGDFVSAIEASAKARLLLWASPTFEIADYEFYSALARAASWDSAMPDRRQEHFDALEAHYKQLAIWAKHCPANFEDRAALVGAEIARLEGREVDAERMYEQAIRSARANGYAHNEALAYETAARFHAVRGLENFSEVFLAKARDGYMHWGAHGKVRQLEARYPWLAMAEARGRARATTTPDQQLDVAAVVKASQALSSEMLLAPLIERLMAIALQNGGADRGLLIRPDPKGYRIEAEARTEGAEIVLNFSGSDGPSVPETLIRYVMRTHESVILDDAMQQHLFSEDPYLLLRRPRSILCLPLVRQAALSGLLYLENTLAPGVFTAERARLLELLASQAAISLENAALYADLELQVGLLQRLPVSAWTLKPDGTPEFVNQVWLEFAGQDLDFVRSYPEAWTAAIHPEDRETTAKNVRDGVLSGRDFAMEYRALRARDRVYRSVLSQAVVLRDPEGRVLKFVGTTTDIDDQKRAEDALRQAHADLARVNRVTTMGELAASLVHEVSQPVSGALTNTAVCLRTLERDTPDIEEVRGVVRRIARDTQRAAEIIDRIRSQFRKSSPTQEMLDASATILEIVALLRSEAVRYDIAVRTDLSPDLPPVVGDRVQLQQVVMNLFVNSIEAMKEVEGTRVIVVRSRRADGHVLVSVSDTGTGLPPHVANKMFDPFFTTKPHGTGMGLRISRSIVESHGGRLWAAANDGPGATLTFSLPCLRGNPVVIARTSS
jgi:predicted ATPase/signal transduction histidine kinase